MVRNKRGQIFSLLLVFFTLFLCGVVIMLYFVQQSGVYSSLVSPTGVLLLRDDLDIFELREVELIKSSYGSASGDFGSEEFMNSFRNGFIDGFMINSDMRDFIFSNLFIGGVEIREQDKNRNLLDSGIYSENLISFDGDKIIFGRRGIEKRVLLVAEDQNKNDFPVYFTFEFDRSYSIDKNGEVIKI